MLYYIIGGYRNRMETSLVYCIHVMRTDKKNLIANNNGFTLTELVVVMFLLSIVMAMAISITLIVNRSEQKYLIDSNGEAEILKLETEFKDWLMLFDSKGYKLTIPEGTNIIEVVASTNTGLYIKFDNGTLTYSKFGEDGEPITSTLAFSSINKIEFFAYGTQTNTQTNKDIVCCVAYIENTGYTHKILHIMRSATIQTETTKGK